MDKVPLEQILAELESDNGEKRCCATFKLRPHGPDAVVALPALFKLLLDTEIESPRSIRRNAIICLGNLAIPFLLEQVKSPNPAFRLEALCLIEDVGFRRASTSISSNKLRDGSRDEFLDWGCDPQIIFDIFKAALNDDAIVIRHLAAGALEDFSVHREETLPVFIETLSEGTWCQRNWAAVHLGRIGRPAIGTVEALKAASHTDNHYSAYIARNALARIEGHESIDYPEEAPAKVGLPDQQTTELVETNDVDIEPLDQVLTELESDDWITRSRATRKLNGHVPDAVIAIPTLFKLIFSDGPAVASGIRVVIRRLGNAAIPYLLEAAVSSDPEYREEALLLIRCFHVNHRFSDPILSERNPDLPDWGCEPQIVLDLFKGALDDEVFEVRFRAALSYDACGLNIEDTIPIFIEACHIGNRWYQYYAALRLGRIGPAASGAIPALKEATNSNWNDAAHAATRAIARIEGRPIPDFPRTPAPQSFYSMIKTFFKEHLLK